jgi:ABC-type multidrug transport system fused ATPase/permease subunit
MGSWCAGLFEKGATRVFVRLMPYIRRYPLLVTAMLGVSVSESVMVIVFPVVTQRIIEDVIQKKQSERLAYWFIMGVIAFAMQDGLNCMRILLDSRFEQKVIFNLRSELYIHLQRLPLSWFEKQPTGDLMTRLIEDVTYVQRMLIDGIEQGAIAILQIAAVSVLMFVYSPVLAMAAFIPVPFLIVGATLYKMRARVSYRDQRLASSQLYSILHDNITGIRQIKIYTAEQFASERFGRAARNVWKAILQTTRIFGIYRPLMNFSTSFGILLVMVVGSREILAGRMDISVLMAFVLVARFIYESVSCLHSLNQVFQEGRASGDRIFEILDAETEFSETHFVTSYIRPVVGHIEYRNATFGYVPGRLVIDNVSFSVKPGEKVAIVGASGAGKSTLVSLLARYYDLQSGSILVDGHDISKIQHRELRQSIAVVTQESFLFNGSTMDNMRMACPWATESEIWDALEAANAAQFVRRLPSGLHSSLGEHGVHLSVGERQRLSIARALLKDAPILILDEATASVDTYTEQLIQQSFDRLIKNRTTLVIAHRLSTIRNADQILVLDQGRIVERGRHEQLVSLGGLYSYLLNKSR